MQICLLLNVAHLHMCGRCGLPATPPPHQYYLEAYSSTWIIMAAVIVHGGAYAIPDNIVEPSLRGCQLAAKLSHKALEDGKSALDAGINGIIS